MQALTPAKTTTICIAVLVLAAARAVAANDRLAVLVVARGEPELSDNLTEVAISKLAQRREHLLVGLREVRESLGDIDNCVEQPACLARLGAAARAESALIGDVRREGDRFVVRLSLVNTRTAVRDADFTTTTPADMKPLIAAIRQGIAAVFEQKLAVPVVPIAVAQAGPASGGQPQEPPPALDVRKVSVSPPSSTHVGDAKRAPKPRWLAGVAYGVGGVAVVAFSAAVVTGRLATATPTGESRAEAAVDLERREDYATAANNLFIVGGALAIAAVATLLWAWRHD